MTARKIFYIVGSAILISFLVWQLATEAAAYPPDIQQRIERADIQFICKRDEPRKVSTIVYPKRDEDWLVRIFSKDNKELEIWLNESVSWSSVWLWFSLATADKIYYYADTQWLDQNDLPEEESQRLYDRLRFTGSERSFFIECFKQKIGAAP